MLSSQYLSRRYVCRVYMCRKSNLGFLGVLDSNVSRQGIHSAEGLAVVPAVLALVRLSNSSMNGILVSNQIVGSREHLATRASRRVHMLTQMHSSLGLAGHGLSSSGSGNRLNGGHRVRVVEARRRCGAAGRGLKQVVGVLAK